MNHRLACIALSVVTALIASLLPATASANTSQIGSNLGFPMLPYSCTGCIGVQSSASSVLSTLPFKSPANGVVTSWSVRSNDVGAQYALRILRQASANSFASVGRSPAPGPITSATDAVHTYTASLTIGNGDNIGVEVTGGNGLPDHFTGNSADVDAYAPTFADGTSATFVTSVQGHELLLQATIKYCAVPDVHKQKKVNAKTALTNADCGVKVKKKETHKKKFRGKVLKQKKAPNTTFPPGTVVPIVIGQK